MEDREVGPENYAVRTTLVRVIGLSVDAWFVGRLTTSFSGGECMASRLSRCCFSTDSIDEAAIRRA